MSVHSLPSYAYLLRLVFDDVGNSCPTPDETVEYETGMLDITSEWFSNMKTVPTTTQHDAAAAATEWPGRAHSTEPCLPVDRSLLDLASEPCRAQSFLVRCGVTRKTPP